MKLNYSGRLALGFIAACISSNLVWADPPELEESATVVSHSEDEFTETPRTISATAETETVRERFKSGKVHIEKEVVLSDEGDFVNHGTFTEFNEKGELVQTGTFARGLRSGAWVKVVGVSHSKLLESFPYNKFKAPFQSTAEFVDGEMTGVWSVTDADNRVVSTISLQDGIRHGHASWNVPTGISVYEADYDNGVLHGLFVEKDASGKVVKQLVYEQGSVTQTQKETFPNKSPKSELQVLTGRPKLLTRDSFDTLTLATYAAAGESVRHGAFVFFHENGTVRTRGNYNRGELDGSFEGWHANGERECVGEYAVGQQSGKWTWWHENGMRMSSGYFEQGKLQGELLAWDEKGKKVQPKFGESGPEVAGQTNEPTKRRR